MGHKHQSPFLFVIFLFKVESLVHLISDAGVGLAEERPDVSCEL